MLSCTRVVIPRGQACWFFEPHVCSRGHPNELTTFCDFLRAGHSSSLPPPSLRKPLAPLEAGTLPLAFGEHCSPGQVESRVGESRARV